MKPQDYIGKCIVSQDSSTIWFIEPSGTRKKFAEIVNWSNIRSKFKKENGRHDDEEAVRFHVQLAAFVAQAINEKIQRDSIK